MACATLKRTLDWEALNQRPTKRRRCNPLGQTTGNGSSPSRSSVASTLYDNVQSPSGSRISKEPQPNPFTETNLTKISPDKIAQDIRDEIKRLHRCKRLQFPSSNVDGMQQDSESSGSEMGADSPRRPDTPPSLVRNPEKALFTFKQVQLICERMLKEREDEIRENYNAVLTTKLAEQYDAFVKFTYDQIQRRYEATPSYLS
ncbi:PREDICTED: akirin [Bactrocera latifrons]|uniref:Akirin n=3 Tax=Endopterygota TaxID=33392 RepID=A0A034WPL1_BACDO|nr:PREDICTED: akirin [Bactrocera latifrons]XP_018790268.1 PREDICTED: akirin [Bactrocera latifrons]XP_018790269.1 PREDICTED: akirin [Bactrocera latifrons]XP_039965449.1 akirin [Bactrocera tryoni]XP_039965451.1 akirin [Bactrocera tryoni]XP_050334562.1 akirin [Bactrocera neohumeralis]XP_050334563.1 akirin [Bactrocera neohumeralis]